MFIRALQSKMDVLESAGRLELADTIQGSRRDITLEMHGDSTIKGVFQNLSERICTLLAADGCAVVEGARGLRVGSTPRETVIQCLGASAQVSPDRTDASARLSEDLGAVRPLDL